MSVFSAEPSHTFELTLFISTLIFLAIIIKLVYSRSTKNNLSFDEPSGFEKVLANKYYVDEIYESSIIKPLRALSAFLAIVFENRIVDGVVSLPGKTADAAGQAARRIQTGNVGFYIFAMVLGILAILSYLHFLS